jgi:hypothetical protein
LIHELLVYHPAPAIVETLGFHQDFSPKGKSRRKMQQDEQR